MKKKIHLFATLVPFTKHGLLLYMKQSHGALCIARKIKSYVRQTGVLLQERSSPYKKNFVDATKINQKVSFFYVSCALPAHRHKVEQTPRVGASPLIQTNWT